MSTLRAVVACLGALVVGSVSAQQAEWIWVTAEARDGQAAYLVRGFAAGGEIAKARVVATCDNNLVLYVNGEEVARSDRWEAPVGVDVTEQLRAGRNSIAAGCLNDGGPGAFALRLDITYTDGSTERIVSSADWRAAEEPVDGWNEPGFNLRSWDRAVSLGSTANTSLTWGAVMTVREATPASMVEAPEGFGVELVRSAQSGEGSWVCLTIDPDGHAIVSPESGGIYRIVHTGPGESRIETVSDEVGMCQGLLYAYGSLYATVTENADKQGGLHRLWDNDGDGVYETRRVLAEFPQRSEHGPHGLQLGPDGMIYTVHGNYTPLPEKLDVESSPYRNWAEDLLLPRLWDPRGHAVNIMSPGARVLRTDENGESWHIVAAGMRNPYDIAFAPNGELFTYDSDMEWDIGLPWYRAPRVIHVVEGGEYGWRSGTGKWPDWYPDSLPPVCDTDLSSPVGVAFAKPGNFPEPWASALFIGDWAYGRIAAVHLEENGASYTGHYDTFVLGLPLSITDIEFGDDGAMWFTTGGRGTQSGLYRVTYEGSDPVPETERMASVTDAAARRRAAEAMGPGAAGTANAAAAMLADEDRFVRFAARLAVERFGGIPAVKDPAGVAQLTLALARDEKLTGSLGVTPLMMLAEDEQVGQTELVRALHLAMARHESAASSGGSSIIAKFNDSFPTGDERLDWLLAELLAGVDAPGLGARLLERIEASDIREEQIHAALCLRVVAGQLDGGELDRYFGWMQEAKGIAGGMSFRGFIEAIEREALEQLGDDDRTRMEAMIAAATIAPPAPPARPIVQQWDTASALAALDRNTGEAAEGESLFVAARCIECHRFGGVGGSTGPDLTSVASRFGRRDLLEALIEPSKIVSDQYKASVVTLNDGRELVGRLLQITGGRMHLLTDPYSHAFERIDPSTIVSVEDSPVSPMPPALLDSLNASELADLVAYLEAGAGR